MALTDHRDLIDQGKSTEDAINLVDSSTDDSVNTSTDSEVQVIAVAVASSNKSDAKVEVDEKKVSVMNIKDFKRGDLLIEGSDEKEKFRAAVTVTKNVCAKNFDPKEVITTEPILVAMMNELPNRKNRYEVTPGSRLLHSYKTVVFPYAMQEMEDEKKKEEEKKAAEQAEREDAIAENDRKSKFLLSEAVTNGSKANVVNAQQAADLSKRFMEKFNL